MPFKELLSAWSASTPYGVPIEPSKHLRGIALTDKDMIEYFPADSLSPNIKLRLQRMFEQRKHWTIEEIFPYLEGYSDDLSVFLAKNCKISTRADGVRLYS